MKNAHYSTTVRQDVDANATVTAVSTSKYLGRAPRNSRFSSTARELAGSGQRLPRGQPNQCELDRPGIGVAPSDCHSEPISCGSWPRATSLGGGCVPGLVIVHLFD